MGVNQKYLNKKQSLFEPRTELFVNSIYLYVISFQDLFIDQHLFINVLLYINKLQHRLLKSSCLNIRSYFNESLKLKIEFRPKSFLGINNTSYFDINSIMLFILFAF